MNNDPLKELLVRDKAFLKALANGPNVEKNNDVLENATDYELDTILKYLHYVANGKISISKANFALILKSKKLGLIRKTIEKNGSLKKMLQNNRKLKIGFLLKLSSIMPFLLYGLFNLK